jgi:hypothetical protein
MQVIFRLRPDYLLAAPWADADTSDVRMYKAGMAVADRKNTLEIGGAGLFAAARKCLLGGCSIDGL